MSMSDPKICLACAHFQFDCGSPYYSSLTPGCSASAECRKKHWPKRCERGSMLDTYSAADMFEFNLIAQTCPDYEVSERAKAKGWKP